MYCLLILYGPIIFWREWSAMIIGSKEHWEIYFSAMIAFQPQVPNGETLFQRQRRILPNRSASTLGWTWQPISIFGNFYKLPNMWLQPGRFIALWKICIKTYLHICAFEPWKLWTESIQGFHVGAWVSSLTYKSCTCEINNHPLILICQESDPLHPHHTCGPPKRVKIMTPNGATYKYDPRYTCSRRQGWAH